MASEAEVPEPSLIERLISSRNSDLSLFLPIILGFTNNLRDSNETDPDQETENPTSPRESRDRIILINPLTQGMVVIEGSSSSVDSLLRGLLNKDGQPPASKASVESMPSVEMSEGEDEGVCVICLEEWEVGGVAKEMPCKHRFHGGCIEKWLGVHGSCPVCRYKMPVDDEELIKKSDEERRGRRREIWVRFAYQSNDSIATSTPPRHDHGFLP